MGGVVVVVDDEAMFQEPEGGSRRETSEFWKRLGSGKQAPKEGLHFWLVDLIGARPGLTCWLVAKSCPTRTAHLTPFEREDRNDDA